MYRGIMRLTYLKFYRIEERYNADLYDLQIHSHQAQLLANKLSRHFHFRKIEVLHSARSRGHAYWRYINIPTITTIGLVIHEIAHIWNHARFGNMKHNKKLHATIKRLSKYFRSHLLKQFSSLELPKPKAKKTPLQKYEQRLTNNMSSIQRLNTKIKTLKTRLRTAKKKQTYLKKQIRTFR